MQQINRRNIHQQIYLFGLAFLITCIPLSLYLLSIAQFLLTLNWLIEGNFREKYKRLNNNKSILLFSSVFLLYGIGCLYSENSSLALDKLKNTLPLLALPLIIGTSAPPGEKTVKRLLLLFCAGVTAAAVACVVNYLINGLPPDGDFRQISIILPHTRFAILIVMAIVILLYYTIYSSAKGLLRLTYIVPAFFLTGFLFFLRSATGIMIFIIVSFIFFFNVSLKLSRPVFRKVVISALLLLSASLISIIAFTWRQNFNPGKINYSRLERFTINGNPYIHDTLSGVMENGYLTGLYLNEHELSREWNKLSSIDYNKYDLRGQPVNTTIKRYLTSKGLRKDSVSIHLLSKNDIKKIEHGLANYKFCTNPGISQRLYETLYDIHVFKQMRFAEHHSFGQRMAFAIESFRLFKLKPIAGVGQGDVYSSMLAQAKKDGIGIDPRWEGKPHNQFAFFIIAFGIIGFLWILLCWIIPVVKLGSEMQFNLFAVNILVSMLVIDTLESYSSMVFFALFYSLLIFGKNTDMRNA